MVKSMRSGQSAHGDVLREVQADRHIAAPLLMSTHVPPPSQAFAGRHEQVTVVPHDAGTVRQYGAGGVHGGGSQPGPATGTFPMLVHCERYVYPPGH
jgi:hypothetical protein